MTASTGGEQRIIGVFKGGGAKGALYCGALEAVRDRGLWFSQVAGSSAGAITAAFVAAGAGPEELRSYEEGGRALLVMPSATSGALNVRKRGGILSFEDLRCWLVEGLTSLYEDRLGGTGAATDEGPTFDQLEAAGGIPLHIACADLRWRMPAVFNARLSPDLPVAVAAAASSAIPLVFDPPTLLSGGDLARETKVVLSDGGVMANLPLFIFSDEGFRAMAGYEVSKRPDPDERPDPIVGFTFVESDSPRHTSRGGKVGDEYQRRLATLIWALTPARLHSLVKGDAASERENADAPSERDKGDAASERDNGHVPGERDKGDAASERGDDKPAPIRRVATTLLLGVLRGIEGVVLPPLTWLLKLTVRQSYVLAHLDMKTGDDKSSRRARRWLRFVDTAFDQAPGLLFFGVALLVLVLLIGIPDAVALLWPDWSAIVEGRGAPEAGWRIIGAVLTLLIAGSALILVITIQVLGLGSLVAGWVIKPVAAYVGPDLLATFLHNPQEPAWAGAGKETIIQIRVPDGWSALKSTDDPREMNTEISKVRESVRKQLECRELGRASA